MWSAEILQNASIETEIEVRHIWCEKYSCEYIKLYLKFLIEI